MLNGVPSFEVGMSAATAVTRYVLADSVPDRVSLHNIRPRQDARSRARNFRVQLWGYSPSQCFRKNHTIRRDARVHTLREIKDGRPEQAGKCV